MFELLRMSYSSSDGKILKITIVQAVNVRCRLRYLRKQNFKFGYLERLFSGILTG